MTIALGVALVLTLVLLVVWFAVPQGPTYVQALFYCAGAVWFCLQLFLKF